MAIIPLPDPTLELMYQAIEADAAAQPDFGRTLGMGAEEDCDRRTAYAFRKAKREKIDYATQFRFDDGNHGEDLTIARLKLIPGITLIDRDPETYRQFVFKDLDGHSKGKMDGVILGLVQAPKKWHVLEVKIVSDKKLTEFRNIKSKFGEKHALLNWNLKYYKQAQKYCHYTGLDRHYTVIGSPGGRAYESCRTDYDVTFAMQHIEKARRIIFDNELPVKISNDKNFYLCKMCPAKEICHGSELPSRDCRNCLHSSPIENGQWFCDRWMKTLDILEACATHKFLPDFIAGKAIAADDFGVTYQLKDGTIFKDGEE